MAVTELEFLNYEQNRVKKYGAKFKNKISALFDYIGEFNEENWNGGDPLRDYAENLYKGLNDKRVISKTIIDKSIFDEYTKIVRDIKIHHFNFKGYTSLEVFSDESFFYAIYNNTRESLILKWRNNCGRTDSVIIIENRDIKFNFYANVINDEYLSYSFLSINDYIDMMNDFNLNMNEFE